MEEKEVQSHNESNVVSVSEFKSSKNKLQSACDSIYKLARSFGYSKDEAENLRSTKKSIFGDSKNYVNKLESRNHIELGLLLPLGIAVDAYEWFQTPLDEREMMLWEAGMDVKEHGYMEDVLCTTTYSGQFCGFCVFGNERTDDEWVEKVNESGNKVSSLEAQLANKGDVEFSEDVRKLNG